MTDYSVVEATDLKYRILRHEPTGAVFDGGGRSLWPLDQFTHRLVAEGSVRLVGGDETPPDPAAPASALAPAATAPAKSAVPPAPAAPAATAAAR